MANARLLERSHLLLEFSDLCVKLWLGERRTAFAPKRSLDDLSKVRGLALINGDADGFLPILRLKALRSVQKPGRYLVGAWPADKFDSLLGIVGESAETKDVVQSRCFPIAIGNPKQEPLHKHPDVIGQIRIDIGSKPTIAGVAYASDRQRSADGVGEHMLDRRGPFFETENAAHGQSSIPLVKLRRPGQQAAVYRAWPWK
jgi:hypothetical protein